VIRMKEDGSNMHTMCLQFRIAAENRFYRGHH
jgi:hypothetical protein